MEDQETNENRSDLELRVIEALKTVYDPEIPVNIYDLGLIYEVKAYPDDSVYIKMTLTAPNCPAAGTLPIEAEHAARSVEGVTNVRLEMTYDPPYSLERMSEAARLELGFM